jgi:small GTP-binding protein
MSSVYINYKYVIVGQSSVGKSAILVRFTDNVFKEDYMTTIGVDFKFRKLNIGGKDYKLQIWDTAGQERYQTITKTFYKNSHAVVIVFDVTSMESFLDIEKVCLEEVKKNCDENVVLMLIGNKIDLEDKREVSRETAEKFANQHNMIYEETSAKTGKNIDNIFINLTQLVTLNQEKNNEAKTEIKLDNLESNNFLNKKCC